MPTVFRRVESEHGQLDSVDIGHRAVDESFHRQVLAICWRDGDSARRGQGQDIERRSDNSDVIATGNGGRVDSADERGGAALSSGG